MIQKQRTKLISFSPKPRKLWSCGPVFLRPNPILPVIGSNEVSARIPNHGNIKLPKGRDNIGTIAMSV